MRLTTWTTCPLAGVLLLLVAGAWAVAQTPQNDLPDDWRGLTTAEFTKKAHGVFENKEPLSPKAMEAVRSYAAQLLRDPETASKIPYDQRLALFEFARSKLTATERAEQEAALKAVQVPGDVKEWDLWKMHFTHRRMGLAGVDNEERQSMLVSWLTGRDLKTLDHPWSVGWMAEEVGRAGVTSNSFKVTWTGQIEAPQDGSYTFLTTPINVNCQLGTHGVTNELRVWVGGKLVLEATHDDWAYRGKPLEMAAGKRLPIRIEFNYWRCPMIYMPHYPAVAKLSWEMPGGASVPVPESALLLPDGSGNGLQAEYVLNVDGKSEEATRTDAMIDHVWFDEFPVLPQQKELSSQLIERFVEVALDPGYLATWDGPEKDKVRHVIWSRPRLLKRMTQGQHAECLDQLLARPVVLEAHGNQYSNIFYWFCRFAAPEKALDVLGTWFQLHNTPDLLLGGSDPWSRGRFATLADAIVFQYRPHMSLLEERYLAMPDGTCCLPAAYTLCHAYRLEGRMEEWIEKLDARLAELPPVGDQRVNWLIARAAAEEIRQSHPGRFGKPLYRDLAGRTWLESALLAAETEEGRLLVARELAGRLAAKGRFDEARELLDPASETVSGAMPAAALATLRGEVTQVEQQLEDKRIAREALATNAYANRLRERRQKALQAGRQDAAVRYEQMLTAAGEALE